ncbi:uncharacterized protein LOC120697399 [Panicum virgatum]|nr:uncharacterized protein LOC120697399 [Panicum virgatum]
METTTSTMEGKQAQQFILLVLASSLATNQKTHTMFRNKNRFLADGEVSVQKVDKIEPVYNLVRRPAVYTNPTAVTVVAKLLPADVAVSDQKMFRGPLKGVPSKKDIDDYIAMKKKQFVEPDP